MLNNFLKYVPKNGKKNPHPNFSKAANFLRIVNDLANY